MDVRKFGELVNQARKRGKLTQQRLADLMSAKTGLYFSQPRIANWCKGKNLPSDRDTFLVLCEALYSAGGLTSLDEINDVLFFAGAGALHRHEIEKWFPKLVSKPLPPPQNNKDKDEPFVNQPRSVHFIGKLLDFGESSFTPSLPDSEASTPAKVPAPLRGYPVVGVLSLLLVFSLATMSFIWSMSGEEPKKVLSPPSASANVTEVVTGSTSITDTVDIPTDIPTPLVPEQPTLSSMPTQTTTLTETPSLITPILTPTVNESAISPSATVESPTNSAAASASTPTNPIATATLIPAVIPTTTTPVIPSSTAAVPPTWTPVLIDTPTVPTVPPPATSTHTPPTVPPTWTSAPTVPPTWTSAPIDTPTVPTVPPPPTSTHTPTALPPTLTHTPTVPPPPTHTPTEPPTHTPTVLPTHTPTVPPTHTPTVPPSPTFTPKPDLIVSSLTVTSFTEESISYSYDITNIGQAPANLDGTSGDHNNVSVQAVLSQDTIFEPHTGDAAAGGTILGLSPLGQLEPGESFSGSFSAGHVFNSSHQYLVLMVDWSGMVDESDETNNTTATYLPPISQ